MVGLCGCLQMIVTRKINMSKIAETHSKLHHFRLLRESEALLTKTLRMIAKKTERGKLCSSIICKDNDTIKVREVLWLTYQLGQTKQTQCLKSVVWLG